MKILFFSHYYTPEGNAPATRVSALCERWVKAGHDVTVVTCAPNVPNGVVYDGYVNRRCSETINGVKVERVKTYIAANKGSLRRMLNFTSYFFAALFAALRFPKPDVVIATSPQIFCGYVGVWYKRLRRVPLIVEIRDIWPESMSAVGARVPRFAMWGLGLIEKAMYRVCDRLVTVGEGYFERLAAKGVPREKMSIVMNGTDLETFSPRPKNRELLKKYGLEDKFVVSYIGTVGMACGLQVVLDAAEKINSEDRRIIGERREGRGRGNRSTVDGEEKVEVDGERIVFVIVGDGAERARLEEQVKIRGLDNIVFTGRQPKSTMPDWVASSDVNLVHLKKTDLFTTVMPSKIFESAGCARPILMGVDGFAKKLVMDAGAGIPMEPCNVSELVDGVKRFAADPELCKRLGQNAYDNIAKVHNRDRQAEDYLRLLGGEGRSRSRK